MQLIGIALLAITLQYPKLTHLNLLVVSLIKVIFVTLWWSFAFVFVALFIIIFFCVVYPKFHKTKIVHAYVIVQGAKTSFFLCKKTYNFPGLLTWIETDKFILIPILNALIYFNIIFF